MLDIKSVLEQLKIMQAKSYEGNPFQDALKKIVEFYMGQFSVREDEVSIFLTDKDKAVLSFAYPQYLVDSGMIPITSPDAFTVYIYNLGRGTIDNSFSQQKHLHLFETIPTPDKKIKPIWKIMGTVMRDRDLKFGVIEISRKAEDAREAGQDFNPDNLNFLDLTMGQIAPVLRKLVPENYLGKLT